MDIDIVIPNYNGSLLFRKNLPLVLEARGDYRGKIIIVDDGSTSSDYESLKSFILGLSERRKIELIRHIKNKGFSSAVNTGVAYSEAEFVVLLNSDVVPKKDFLKNPIQKLKDSPNLFGVGCMDESVEDGRTIHRGRGLGTWKKGFVLHSKGEVDRNDTFWISGGSCIIRRDLFEKLGGFDTLYNPFYWEDIDLSYRVQKAGYKILFDNTSIVKHEHFEGAIKKNFKNSYVNKISYRNQFIFVWKNIDSSALLTNHFLYLPLHIIGALKTLNFAFLMGLFLALAKLPAIIKKRKKQKKFNKVSDVEVIGHIS